MVALDAEPVSLAGAFVLGTVVATFAMLRVVRAVADYFAAIERRRRRREPADDDQ